MSASAREGLCITGTFTPIAGMRIQFWVASAALYAGVSGTCIGYGFTIISGSGVANGTSLSGLTGS